MSATRDVRYDTAKGVLIILVVAGHALESASEFAGWRGGGPWAVVFLGINTVHMPAFAFLSGLLTSERRPFLTNVRDLLMLYVVAQLLWCLYCFALMPLGQPRPSNQELLLVSTGYGLWYLLALFYWRVAAPLLFAVKRPTAMLVLLCGYGVFVGFADRIGGEFTLSRAIGFFPFFAAGLWSRRPNWPWLSAFRPVQDIPWLVLSLAAGVAAVYLAYLHSASLLTLSQPYWSSGVQLRGAASRILMYVAAFGGIRVLLLVAPRSDAALGRLGRSSLSIYIGHFYVLFLLRRLIPTGSWVEHLPWLAPAFIIFNCWLFSRFPIGAWMQRGATALYERLFHLLPQPALAADPPASR